MAAVNWYPNGLGGASGDELVTLTKLYTSGTTWFVNSVTGTDAAAPAGKRREKPLKTTGQALTNAAAGDIICWTLGHNESVSSVLTVSKAGLLFASEGSGSSRARLTCAVATELFDITAAGVWICNAYFPASTTTPVARIRSAAQKTVIRGCYFEEGILDTTDSVKLITNSGTPSIRNCSFVSVSTNPASQPATSIEFANALSDVDLTNVTFDSGSSGRSAAAILGTAAVTRLVATDIDLLNDTLATFVTGTTGFLYIRNSTGNSEVIWTP